MTYTTEFPHYDDVISLPEGWIDTSWHNDVCPSFEKVCGDVTIRLWCDFKNPASREVGGTRFIVCQYDANDDEFFLIGQSESMDEALALIDRLN